MKLTNQLPGALLPWYNQNKRDLPWRADREPYHVWLSEIMLQQTRVEAVKGYYRRFLDVLPTVSHLANCNDDTLHKLWEGLGYYSRVRNLKKAAQVIMTQYGGQFPGEYRQVLALPGIGEYTAGAICSICFDLPTPAVDGNVLRVISRITDDSTPVDLPQYKKLVQQGLQAIYPAEAGNFTQALMELGATVCGPNRKPDCENCPCKGFCLGFARGTAPELPVKLPKKGRKLQDMTVLILSSDGRYAVRKRQAQGLLAGLWEFPNLPGKLELPAVMEAVSQMGLSPKDIRRQLELNHIFTHVQWNMTGYYLEVADTDTSLRWLTPEEIDGNIALPTAFRQFWDATK